MQESNHNPYDDQQGYDAPTLPYMPNESTQPQEVKPADAGSAPTLFPDSAPTIAPGAYDPYAFPNVPGYPPAYPTTDMPSYGIGENSTGENIPISPKRGRRALWITLGSVVAVVAIAVASFFGVSYINRPTPTKTLDTFCKALQDQNYQAAYDQFSKSFQQSLAQNSIAEADFANILSQDKVDTCTHGAALESGTSTTTTLKLVHHSQGVNNDRVTLIKDSTNNWKINDLQGAG
jgi:hypothetical protein